MKKAILIFALFAAFSTIFAQAQAVRVDLPLLTSGPNVPVNGQPLPETLWVANATVNLCTHPAATLAACLATPIVTYTDSTETQTCPSATQLVELPGRVCSASAGLLGNLGFWYAGGTVDYFVTTFYGTFGPYSVSAGVGGPANLPFFNASLFPGSSIVEQINNAVIAAASGGGGQVYIPAGQYTADDCSNWQTSSDSYLAGGFVGVLIPSNVSILGAGKGATTITVPYTGNYNCALFANQNHGTIGVDSDIEIRDLSVNWVTPIPSPGTTPQKLSLATYFNGASNVHVDNDTFTGNPNAMSNFLDVSDSSYDHNECYLKTNDYYYGDTCLSIARFSNTSYQTQGYSVTVFDNLLQETYATAGDTNFPFSVVVVGATNADIEHNRFDLYSQLVGHTPTTQRSIESGTDNFSFSSYNLTIQNNEFMGGVMVSDSATQLTVQNNIYTHTQGIGLTSNGSASSGSEMVVAQNTVRCDGTFASTSCGIAVTTGCGTGTVTPVREAVFEGNHIFGGHLEVINCSFNSVVNDNDIHNSQTDCFSINGARTFKNNTCSNSGQASPASVDAAINIGGTLGSSEGMTEVSGNSVTDDQTAYSTGTVCTVPDPASTTCQTSGTGHWLYVSGGTWSQAWTNPSIYLGAGQTQYFINNFMPDGVHAELQDYVPYVASGTSYLLTNTIYIPMQFNNTSVTAFENNTFKTNTAWNGGYGISCVGSVNIAYFANIYTNSGAAAGSCGTNYFLPVAPGSDYIFSGTISALGTGSPGYYQARGIFTPAYDIEVTGFEVDSLVGAIPSCSTYPVVQINGGTDTITLNANFVSLVPLPHPFEVLAGTLLYVTVTTHGTQCTGAPFPTQSLSYITCAGSSCTWVSGNTFEELNSAGSQGTPVTINGQSGYFVNPGGNATSITINPPPGSITNQPMYSASTSPPPDYTFTVHYSCRSCGGGGGGGGGGGSFTPAGDLTGTGASQEVVGLLNHALPSLSAGYLNWSGSAWALTSAAGMVWPSGSAGFYPYTGSSAWGGTPYTTSGSGTVIPLATSPTFDGTTVFNNVTVNGTCTGCTGTGTVNTVSGDGTLITNSLSSGGVTLTTGNAAAHSYWGNNTGSTAAAGFNTLASGDIPNNAANTTGSAATLTGCTGLAAAGDSCWYNGSSWTRLTGNSGSTAVLTETSGSPSWSAPSSGMIWPSGAGVANYAGSSTWGTSYTVGTAASNLVQLNGSAQLPAVSGVNLTGLTATQVGLGSVTNNSQALLSIWPSTAPAAGKIPVGNTGGTAYAPVTLSQDCTLIYTGAINCTKTAGTLFAASATSLTAGTGLNGTAAPTSAAFLATNSSGQLIAASGSAGTVSVVGAGALSNTAIVTGGGTTLAQTPNTSATLDSSGNVSTPGGIAGGVGSGKAGLLALSGNTSNPTLPSNAAGFLGPSSASFTSYFLQLPSTAPTTSTSPILSCNTPSSNISSCSWVAGGSGSMTWPSGGAGVPVYSGSSSWGTTLTEYGSAAGISTTSDPGSTAEVPMVADGSHGMKPSASGALGTGAFVAAYTLPTATSSVLGGVKPDGTTIANSSGAISLGLTNANSWTGLQTFGAHASIGGTAHGLLVGENASAVANMAVCGANFPVVGVASADPACSTIGWLSSATQWGLPYMSTATQMSTTAALTANALIKAGSSAAPSASSVIDNGTTVSTSEPLNLTATTNQIVTGTGSNLTTSNYPASSGAVTLTFPVTSEYMVGANSDTTPTHILHATAVAGVFNSAAIAAGDLPGGAGELLAGATPALTYTPTLGVSGTLGSLSMFPTSGNFTTTWASGATASNTIQGFAAVPTTGHLIDCTVTSTTCLLHDSAVVTANVVNASSPGAGIAHFAGSTQTVTSSAVVDADISFTAPAIAGATATTQSQATNSTKVATTAYVDGQNMIVTTGLTAGHAYYISGANTLSEAGGGISATAPAACVAISSTQCLTRGTYTTTGLTSGAVYYVPTTAAVVTSTEPSSTGQFVQRVGVALSTTVLIINPSLDVATIQ